MSNDIFLTAKETPDNRWGWYRLNEDGDKVLIPRIRHGSPHPDPTKRSQYSFFPTINRNKYAPDSVKDSLWVLDKSSGGDIHV